MPETGAVHPINGGYPWRTLGGVEFITSDDHSGLRAACRAVPGGATWQRCQFHLARNAIHHARNTEIRKRIGKPLKPTQTADDLARAETAPAALIASYRDSEPKLANWLEKNVPEALAVFTLPEHLRRRLRIQPGRRPLGTKTRLGARIGCGDE